LIREINEALVLDQLRLNSPIARSTIANRTGLSPATITGITAKLSQAGIISEISLGASAGGRPPRLLAVNPSGGHAVGVRLGDDHLMVATVDLVGEVIMSESIPWKSGSPAEAVEVLADIVKRFDVTGSQLLGLGVAVSGSVDHRAGLVRYSGTLDWKDVPLREMLFDRLGIPVVIDRYVNAMAASLALFGKQHSDQDLIVINVGPSLGVSLVQGGRIMRGAGGAAGGLAHTSVSMSSDRGRQCHCGATGCLETVASEWGMLREIKRLTGQRMTIAAAVRRSQTDLFVAGVLRRGAQALGRAVANLAKVLDPHQVVVGGDGTQMGESFAGPFETTFHKSCRHGAGHDFDLAFVTFDEVSWARGAGCQVLASLFSVE